MTDSQYHPSDITADAQTQQYGYIRCYRAVVRDCGITGAYLYGILEDYAQIGKRTGAGCVPSHEHLVELTGLSEKSVRTYLNDLRDKGWISWRRTGDSNHYTIHSKGTERIGKNYRTDRQNLPNRSVKATDNQDVSNKNDLASPPLPSGGPPLRGSQSDPPVKERQARRLPKDWALSPNLLAWTKARPGWDEGRIEENLAEFQDHWLSKTDRRLDWDATWRNWVRREFDRPPSQRHTTPNGVVSEAELQEFSDRVDRIRGGHV